MAAVYASLFHYFSRGTESLCGTVSYKGFEKFAGWTGMFTPDCPAIPEDRLGVIPGILHIRPCGAGSEPVVYPSLCRHAVRPSRIRSHRTYSVSGLISSLKVMTRDSDRACSLFRGKPSQKPLTIPGYRESELMTICQGCCCIAMTFFCVLLLRPKQSPPKKFIGSHPFPLQTLFFC